MKQEINSCPIRNIKINDSFFSHYVRLVAEEVVPYQWKMLNDLIPDITMSHCIKNFKIVAGEITGEHKGPVFVDTDAYKWLEAVAYCLENEMALEYEWYADELIELIGRAQQSDGYLHTYYTLVAPKKKWTNLAEGHELYGAGHLIEAAVAYYNATGKTKLLDIAKKFADLICQVFGPNGEKHNAYAGHQEIELALVKLYYITDDEKYLDMAEHFVRARGKKPNYLIDELKQNEKQRIFPEFSDYDDLYAQTHTEAAKQTEAVGHSVRAMYYYTAMADLAMVHRGGDFEKACQTLWENTTKKRMYITGGIGSSGHLERFTTDYDLPNDRMYCESCASVGLMMFGKRMAALTGNASYYEEVERALYNTVLAGISLQGDKYFYVNPLEVWPANCLTSTSMAHVKPVRQPWYTVACCPTNIARTIASLGQYIFAKDCESVYVNMLISSSLQTTLENEEVSLDLVSTLLHDGKTVIRIKKSQEKKIYIKVRIPSYYEEPTFSIDGRIISPLIQDGYVVLEISGSGEQAVEIQGKVEPSFVAANTNVRADIGKVALTYGPYVYCIEEIDNGENLPALMVSDKEVIEVLPSVKEFPGDVPSLGVKGQRVESSIQDEKALYGRPCIKMKDVDIKAIPYALWCNRTPGEMQVWIKNRV